MVEIDAITHDGREVILKSDQTWRYAKVKDQRASGDLPSTPWGASLRYVVGAQPSKPTEVEESGELVSYEIRIQGRPFELEYSFDDDRLSSATLSYLDDDVDDDEADLERAWADLCFELEEKFGKPEQLKERGWNDLDKDDFAYWNRSSHLIELRWAVFQDETTRAVVSLRGGRSFLLNVQAEFTPMQPLP